MNKIKSKIYYKVIVGSSLYYQCQSWALKRSHIRGEWLLHIEFEGRPEIFVRRWVKKTGNILLNPLGNNKWLVKVPVDK